MTHSEEPVFDRDQAHTTGGTDPPGVVRAGVTRLLAPDNPWKPIVIKLSSISIGMIGLAAIGLFAARTAPLSETDGINPSPVNAADLSGSWLKPPKPPQASAAASTSQPSAFRLRAAATEGRGGRALSAGAETSPAEHQRKARTPGLTRDGKVILNLASAAELRKLPGIGRKRAEKIIKLRERLKRFRKPTDLLRIRGIGLKSLRKMLPHLVLDPPVEEPAGAGSSEPAPGGS